MPIQSQIINCGLQIHTSANEQWPRRSIRSTSVSHLNCQGTYSARNQHKRMRASVTSCNVQICNLQHGIFTIKLPEEAVLKFISRNAFTSASKEKYSSVRQLTRIRCVFFGRFSPFGTNNIKNYSAKLPSVNSHYSGPSIRPRTSARTGHEPLRYQPPWKIARKTRLATAHE